MPPPTVLIIGCGVAGPVLALLLKRKGYLPIVLEKVKQLGDAGASLMLMPNGYAHFTCAMKCFGLLPHQYYHTSADSR
jgi:salicylate hydroxylase